MHEKKDFQSMTLDELTPIVSMRPGKEYAKEELRIARTVFMEKLGCINPEIEPEEPEVVSSPAETAIETPQEDVPSVETPEPISELAALETANDLSPTIVLPVIEEQPVPVDMPVEAALEIPEEQTAEQLTAEPEETSVPSENEEFILKADSRLARFLYRLYAYLLLPLLALESLSLLLASVGTAVAVSDAPYIFIHVICAAVYTMLISLAWHQFFHRTNFGLLLNRSLIGVCIIRGFLMLISGTDVLWGIIFIAISALFIVYFIGYDSMFIIPSPEKQRVQ